MNLAIKNGTKHPTILLRANQQYGGVSKESENNADRGQEKNGGALREGVEAHGVPNSAVHARIAGRATLFSYSRAAIGGQYWIAMQKAKPLKKPPRGNEYGLSYMAPLVELMITTMSALATALASCFSAMLLDDVRPSLITGSSCAMANSFGCASSRRAAAYQSSFTSQVGDGDPVQVKSMDK